MNRFALLAIAIAAIVVLPISVGVMMAFATSDPILHNPIENEVEIDDFTVSPRNPEMVTIPNVPPRSFDCWMIKYQLLYHLNRLGEAGYAGQAGTREDWEGLIQSVTGSLKQGCW